jgi:hypothetical protein
MITATADRSGKADRHETFPVAYKLNRLGPRDPTRADYRFAHTPDDEAAPTDPVTVASTLAVLRSAAITPP